MNKISHSQTSVLNTCKRKFKYQYVDNLEPKTFNFSLSTGKIFHECIAHLYNTGDLSETFKLLNEISEKIDTSAFTQDDFNQHEKDLVMIQGMLQGAYDIFYLRDQEKNVKILEVEAEYIEQISESYEFHLIIDLLLEIDGKVCLIEYKTASQLGDTYFNRLKIDFQTRNYAALLNKKHNKKIEKIIYRIIKKPGIRIKQNETVSQYLDRLKEEFYSKPNSYFIEQEFSFTKEDSEKAFLNLEQNAQTHYWTNEYKIYPMNTSMCGIINCPFIHLCIDYEGSIDLYKRKEEK